MLSHERRQRVVRFRKTKGLARIREGCGHLRGVRKKLDKDRDRLQLEIEQYKASSQSIIQLAKIVSDGMTIVNKAPITVPEL